MRRIVGISTSRADYGIYRSVFHAINQDPELSLEIIASGTHLCEFAGMTIKEIEQDGFTISHRINIFENENTTELSTAKAISICVDKFSQAYVSSPPDILLVLGDRFEMHAAVLAALPFSIPIAHIHGGELTLGAFDDALRHSITKMSHLHFTSTSEYARRIEQMGEESWRITVCGAPALDNLKDFIPTSSSKLQEIIGLDLAQPPILVTFHPVTLESMSSVDQIDIILEALLIIDLPVVFTAPNADPDSDDIRHSINTFIANSNGKAVLCESLGSQNYFSLLNYSLAMVGNSSSGIIEASSFKLPVVNIGTRQEGRTRSKNVIDTAMNKNQIIDGIKKAISKEYKEGLYMLSNPYVVFNASSLIVDKLKKVKLGDKLIKKVFQDWDEAL